ncbi:MAG: acyl-CoA dehydrogenase family protein [Pseudomonadota bacterium]
MDVGHDYLERVSALGPDIDRASLDVDGTRDIPESLFAKLVDADLFRLLQPRAYGGAELDPLTFTRLIEDVGKHDASVGWCLCQNNVCAVISAYLKPDAAKAMFKSPRDILAWGPGPGEAKEVEGGFELSGKFDFASGSRHATYLGAHVPIVDRSGARRLNDDGKPAILTMLFPKGEVEIKDTWHVIGLRGTGSDSFVADKLFVPHQRAVSRMLGAKKYVDGPLYGFSQSNLYSSGFASLALGIARATVDEFVAVVKDTIPRGAPKPRRENNVVQSRVGQAEARIRSSRAFLRNSLEEIWADVKTTGELSDEQQVTLRLATTWAIQESREVVNSLYLAAGALAIFESQPFEHRFRDIHTLCQQIQGHAAHFETVGQILMGMEPDRSLFSF